MQGVCGALEKCREQDDQAVVEKGLHQNFIKQNFIKQNFIKLCIKTS